MNLKIREVDRDENLGVLQKSVSLPNSFSFSTPSKSTKEKAGADSYISINSVANEITRRVDETILKSLEAGSAYRMTREVQNQYKPNKLNVVIFNLTVESVPDRRLMQTFAQHLYANSDKMITLPTVKSSLYKEKVVGKTTIKYSDARFAKYLKMMGDLIQDIQGVGNNKGFMGTIPLIPIKYARQLIELYQSKGIQCFLLDANTSDALNHETDLRAILSAINERTPLSDSLIYACNLGFSRYEKDVARADDFLSLFAYIDIIGNTFKQKAMKRPPNGAFMPPKVKLFSSADYSYQLLHQYGESRGTVETRNQASQLKEAHLVRDMLGQENLLGYLRGKSAVDSFVIGKLAGIASEVKVK